MATVNDKYTIKNIVIGNFEYNTIFIEKDGEEIQIPIAKEKEVKIGSEIVIKNLFTPIA